MIYVDACYIAKTYLLEEGTAEVREFLAEVDLVASCQHSRVEFLTAVHRHLREGRLSNKAFNAVLDDFERDCDAGFWVWIPLSDTIIANVANTHRNLPASVFIRAGDAMHLACAVTHGFGEIYSNDSHLLKAAPHFGVRGANVIAAR